MKKFLGIVVLLAAAFGAGYFVGQRPVGSLQQTSKEMEKTIRELEKTVKDLSRNAVDTARGIERDLRRRQGLVDAKARVREAREEWLDKNYGDAAKQLAEATDAMEKAMQGGSPQESHVALKDVAGKIRDLRQELSFGRKVPLSKLDEIQKGLDRLLEK
jgi:L-serine deaminase